MQSKDCAHYCGSHLWIHFGSFFQGRDRQNYLRSGAGTSCVGGQILIGVVVTRYLAFSHTPALKVMAQFMSTIAIDRIC